jgi:hypothetical protein
MAADAAGACSIQCPNSEHLNGVSGSVKVLSRLPYMGKELPDAMHNIFLLSQGRDRQRPSSHKGNIDVPLAAASARCVKLASLADNIIEQE